MEFEEFEEVEEFVNLQLEVLFTNKCEEAEELDVWLLKAV